MVPGATDCFDSSDSAMQDASARRVSEFPQKLPPLRGQTERLPSISFLKASAWASMSSEIRSHKIRGKSDASGFSTAANDVGTFSINACILSHTVGTPLLLASSR